MHCETANKGWWIQFVRAGGRGDQVSEISRRPAAGDRISGVALNSGVPYTRIPAIKLGINNTFSSSSGSSGPISSTVRWVHTLLVRVQLSRTARRLKCIQTIYTMLCEKEFHCIFYAYDKITSFVFYNGEVPTLSANCLFIVNYNYCLLNLLSKFFITSTLFRYHLLAGYWIMFTDCLRESLNLNTRLNARNTDDF